MSAHKGASGDGECPDHCKPSNDALHRTLCELGTLGVMIERCASVEQPGWLTLREALWPHCSREEHLAEMSAFLVTPKKYAQFVAYSRTAEPIGFAEVSARDDYINGTETSPVAFLEGLYVIPDARRQSVTTELVAAVAPWGIELGCSELASDALLENELSYAVHKALGFVETERVVFFRKSLR